MRKTIEVVDDFYRDPYARRERALARGPAAPGVPPAHAHAEARKRIAALLGHPEASFPELTGRITFVGAGEEGEGAAPRVHDEQWAALVYLALPEGQFSGGVGFYRPVAAGSAPGTGGSPAVDGAPRSERWEETTYVPLTFNRMVLFRGATAHRCTVRSIDRGPVEDRVAQLFLFDEPDGGR